MVPPINAIWRAASLPLGSIMPYIRSYNDKTYLFLRFALVPVMLDDHSETGNFIILGFRLRDYINETIVYKFIIFVRLAS